MFKKETPEEAAAKQAASDAKQAVEEAQRREQQEAKERASFLRTPVGQAQVAYDRGDLVFQYSHDLISQQAIIVKMSGSSTTKSTSDPSEILNAVAAQGWEIVSGSFVFIEEGSQSRDKFLSSGQNIAVKGRTQGYYLFRRCEQNCRA